MISNKALLPHQNDKTLRPSDITILSNTWKLIYHIQYPKITIQRKVKAIPREDNWAKK